MNSTVGACVVVHTYYPRSSCFCQSAQPCHRHKQPETEASQSTASKDDASGTKIACYRPIEIRFQTSNNGRCAPGIDVCKVSDQYTILNNSSPHHYCASRQAVYYQWRPTELVTHKNTLRVFARKIQGCTIVIMHPWWPTSKD